VIKIKADGVAYYTEEGALEENRMLKQSLSKLKTEIDKYRRSPLLLCELRDIIGNNAIIKIPNGNEFFVEIAETCQALKPATPFL
jgi:ATP-dependent 26S proteasome regulatory subunit